MAEEKPLSQIDRIAARLPLAQRQARHRACSLGRLRHHNEFLAERP